MKSDCNQTPLFNQISETAIRYEGTQVIVDPAQIMKQLRMMRNIFFLIVPFDLLLFGAIAYYFLKFGDMNKEIPVIFSISGFIAVTAMVFVVLYALSWAYPRIFDRVSKRMQIKIPVIPRQFDLSSVQRVIITKSNVHGKQMQTTLYSAMAQKIDGKQIEILRIYGKNFENAFCDIIKQICNAMDWKLE